MSRFMSLVEIEALVSERKQQLAHIAKEKQTLRQRLHALEQRERRILGGPAHDGNGQATTDTTDTTDTGDTGDSAATRREKRNTRRFRSSEVLQAVFSAVPVGGTLPAREIAQRARLPITVVRAALGRKDVLRGHFQRVGHYANAQWTRLS